jgi:NAD(P)-dependent dehydrogenase (short-subunit alcohol dehydrogenase family)
MSGFDGKVAVITGAAGALGSATATHFAAAGARLALLDVAAIDSPHYSRVCDLTDPAACRDAVTAIEADVGRIEVLANIAGGFTMGEAVHETTEDTWNFMMDLNARTVLNMARAVVPGMLERGRGKIVNVGAGAGQHGVAQLGAYSASKSVVIRLTEAMSGELKERGINVNCILPSVIDTPANRRAMPDADFGKWVRPEAMAKVIEFLASEGAEPIHGAALPVVGLS